MAGFYSETNHNWKQSRETRTPPVNTAATGWSSSTSVQSYWTVTVYTCSSCGKKVEASSVPPNEECPVEVARGIHDS